MTFDRALRSSAVLLTATGFVGLLLTRSIPVWLIGMTLASLTYAVWHLTVWPGRRPGAVFPAATVVWNALLIGAFALFVVDLTVISRDLLPAGIHFLVILLNIKLITLQDRRDFRHVYAISLMAVLASAALTTDLWYVSVFVLYVLAAVWSLLLYHLTGRTAAAPPLSASGADADPAASLQITGRFFWLTN